MHLAERYWSQTATTRPAAKTCEAMIAVLVLAAAATSGADPYVIFSRARSRWTSQSYPRYLTYVVTVSGSDGSRAITNTYTSSADTSTDSINVQATSAEESAHPYVPHGMTWRTKITIGYAGKPVLGARPTVDGGPTTIKVSKTMPLSQPQQYDLLGVPVLSPTYSFGLAMQEISSSSAASAEPGVSSNPALRTIASIIAVHRDYDIRYDGTAVVDGATCYHLDLTPRRDPNAFRLRQLWIDESAYTTRQALIQGNFTKGPGPKLPWLIHFTTRDDLMYITDETALGSVRYLGHAYANVAVAFGDLQPVTVPSLTFTLSMFRTSGDVLEEPDR